MKREPYCETRWLVFCDCKNPPEYREEWSTKCIRNYAKEKTALQTQYVLTHDLSGNPLEPKETDYIKNVRVVKAELREVQS